VAELPGKLMAAQPPLSAESISKRLHYAMVWAISASREAGMYRVILEMRDERGEAVGSTDDTVEANDAAEASASSVAEWGTRRPELRFAELLVTQVQP
jgi:hypothetical protein